MLRLFCTRLEPGLVLNCGAGLTGFETEHQLIIHVDHVVPPESPGGLWAVADACALPFRNGVFGGFLCKDVLEHVLDPIAVLQEARRVCDESAKVVATVPRAIPRAVWSDPTHLRGFTSRSLIQTLMLGGWLPVSSPQRMGGFPGARRLRLTRHLPLLMRIPIFGHVFGTNWLVTGVARRE